MDLLEHAPAELKKMAAVVFEDRDNYQAWLDLVTAAENQEGGLTRNSNPQAIEAFRTIFDLFLRQFPLFFGFWNKYAQFEWAFTGSEAAEYIYERGIASVPSSVDLWTAWCEFKANVCHDSDEVRELYERAVEAVGRDYYADKLWDKYLDFENRIPNNQARHFELLRRVSTLTLHQHHRYYESFVKLSPVFDKAQLVDTDTYDNICAQILAHYTDETMPTQIQLDREIRNALETHLQETHNKTSLAVQQDWKHEQNLKRLYFAVDEIPPAEMDSWREYLSFREESGDLASVKFLYARCLTSCAYYDELWMRYTRYLLVKDPGNDEGLRQVFRLGACLYVPIAKPQLRIHWALFEERAGRPTVAEGIYASILEDTPGHFDTIVALAGFRRRQTGQFESALDVMTEALSNLGAGVSADAKAALLGEYAKMYTMVHAGSAVAAGTADEARNRFRDSAGAFTGVRAFWENWLRYETGLPLEADAANEGRVRAVWGEIRGDSGLGLEVVRELSRIYHGWLLNYGPVAEGEAAREYLEEEARLFGPESVRKWLSE